VFRLIALTLRLTRLTINRD